MKQFKWLLFSIVLVCALVNISCTDDDVSPVEPGQTYSESTRELITLVDGNPQLKSLLEKASHQLMGEELGHLSTQNRYLCRHFQVNR